MQFHRLALIAFCFLFQSPTLILCSNDIDDPNYKDSMFNSNHGKGFLARVRNRSEYPISFFQEKKLHDYLPEGTVIRIKSLRPEYGSTGRYYAVRKVVGAYRLVADTLDPNDPATHLTVSRFVARDFTDYIGISSSTAEGKYLQSSSNSREAKFTGNDIKDDRLSDAHWQVISLGDWDPKTNKPGFDNCYLKSRVSGYLQARGTATQSYPGLSYVPRTEISSAASGDRSAEEKTLSNNPGSSFARSTTTQSQKEQSDTFAPIGSEELKAISISSGDHIVGINSSNEAVKLNADETWKGLGRKLSQVVLAGDTSMWGVTRSQQIWKYDGTEWIKMGNTMSSIAAGSEEHVWGVNLSQQAMQKKDPASSKKGDSSWVMQGSKIKSLGVRPDGTIVAITTSNKLTEQAPGSRDWTEKGDLRKLLGSTPKKIAVGGTKHLGVVTVNGSTFILKPGYAGAHKDDWHKLSASFIDLAIAHDGTMVGIMKNKNPERGQAVYITPQT
jgi:hypothetical protein